MVKVQVQRDLQKQFEDWVAAVDTPLLKVNFLAIRYCLVSCYTVLACLYHKLGRSSADSPRKDKNLLAEART